MANVRIYLDTRRAKKNGEYPVKIVVYHANDIMLPANLSAHKSHFENGQYTKLAPNL